MPVGVYIRSEETKRKISLGNKGKRHSDKTKSLMSKLKGKTVLTPKGIFNSYKEAALHYGVNSATIRYRATNEKMGFSLVNKLKETINETQSISSKTTTNRIPNY
jgi:hypothetical protein